MDELVAAEARRSCASAMQALAGRAFDFHQRREIVGADQPRQHWRAKAGGRNEPDGSRNASRTTGRPSGMRGCYRPPRTAST